MTWVPPALAAVFVTALLVALAGRRAAPVLTRWLWLLPAGLFAFFLTLLPALRQQGSLAVTYRWVTAFDLSAAFLLDGLGLLFALLITGIGAAVFLYAHAYLKGDPDIGRFFTYLTIFMGAMLGVVVSGHLVFMFIFWELTSISSYLLIGYEYRREEAKYGALRALIITAGGGLALLGGVAVLGTAAGTFEVTELLTRGDIVRGHTLYPLAVVLIVTGALTKSAQFPFHFWLPNAMEAPTPTSAYLHSATMVKAGVYLVARLLPVLGGTLLWTSLVAVPGLITLVLGSYLALRQDDLKAFLAYTTIAALGLMMTLYGLGHELAVKAATLYVFGHALYKSALFMVVGVVQHETGSKYLSELGGLKRAMPRTALVTWLAALSMAGLPPFIGFIAKETYLEAAFEGLAAGAVGAAALGAVLVFSIMTATQALVLGHRLFTGPVHSPAAHLHEAPFSLWGPPAIPAVLALLTGVLAYPLGGGLVEPAVSAVLQKTAGVKLVFWHGINAPLLTSLVTLAAGLLLYRAIEPFRAFQRRFLAGLSADGLYDAALDGLAVSAKASHACLQRGRSFYMLVILAFLAVVVWWPLARLLPNLMSAGSGPLTPVTAQEFLFAALIVGAAVYAATARDRVPAILALGSVGFLVAYYYVLFRAPDLALTQLLVETLSLVLFVVVFAFLPSRLPALSTRAERLRDLAISGVVGATVFTLVLAQAWLADRPTISGYFVDSAEPLGGGRNVVNVILVDFRGLDTMGEITVVAVAGLGVVALLALRLGRREEESR